MDGLPPRPTSVEAEAATAADLDLSREAEAVKLLTRLAQEKISADQSDDDDDEEEEEEDVVPTASTSDFLLNKCPRPTEETLVVVPARTADQVLDQGEGEGDTEFLVTEEGEAEDVGEDNEQTGRYGHYWPEASAAAPLSADEDESAPVAFGDWAFSDDSGSAYEPPGGVSCDSSVISTDRSGRHSGTGMSSVRPSRAGSLVTATEDIGEDEIILLGADEDLIMDNKATDIPVSYYNALVLNESYQQSIQESIETFTQLLHANHARQREVDEELELLDQQEVDSKRRRGSASASASSAASSGGRQETGALGNQKSLTVFSAPYFKDIRLFSHPPNADTVKKRDNQELDVYLANPKEWSLAEKKKLVEAVREDALHKRMSRDLMEKNRLVSALHRLNADAIAATEEKDNIVSQLKEVKRTIEAKKRMTDEKLFVDRKEDFDWMKISVQTFQSCLTPKSCELMWKNLLHPSIHCGAWSKEEDEMLKSLVTRSGGNQWDQIAAELGTNRTGFLCFMRYQQKHNPWCSNKRYWAHEEDLRLRNLVEKCKLNDYIPWSKISYYMGHRTKEQCYQRYMYSLRDNLRKGPFSHSEDFMLMMGVKLFGKEWSKIADFMPQRTAVQLHSRFNTFHQANLESWRTEDDYRLLEIVREHGINDWVKIASLLNDSRGGAVQGLMTRTQCRNRFYIIYKTYLKNPDTFDMRQLKTSSLMRRRKKVLHETLEQELAEFLQRQRNAREEEKKSGMRKVDVHGYHTTPEGISISRQDLFAFMTNLQRKLPAESRLSSSLGHTSSRSLAGVGVSVGVDAGVGAATAKLQSISGAKLGLLSEPKSTFVRTTKRGKVITTYKRGRGRPAKDVTNEGHKKETRINNALGQFFRSSWACKMGRPKALYTDKELRDISTAAVGLASVLKCQSGLKQKLNEVTESDIDDDLLRRKDYQALEAYRTKIRQQPPPLLPLPSSQIQTNTPPRQMKTYARKGSLAAKASSSSSSGATPPPSLTLVPPCHATLVGFRGLVLYQRRLLQMSMNDGQNRVNPSKRENVNVLSESLVIPDVLNIKSEPNSSDSTPLTSTPKESVSATSACSSASAPTQAESEADRRLFQRIKALFYWPAMMSSIKPHIWEQKDLFKQAPDVSSSSSSESDLPLSASQPFDASQLVENYRAKAPSKRVRIDIVKRSSRSEAVNADTVNTNVDGEDRQEEKLFPPPPHKKRMLAAAIKDYRGQQ